MPEPEAADLAGWTPADHACRFCGGRVMARPGAFACFHCGAETDRQVRNICGCGIRSQAGLYPFVCQANPAPSPTNPARFVIARAAPKAKGLPAK